MRQEIIPRTAALFALLGLGGLGGPPCRAQVSLPSSFDPLVDRREILEEQVEEARWRVGKVKLEPWIRLTDLGLARTDGDPLGGEEPVDDLRGRIAAGLTAFLPLGSKTIATAHLLPEYIWWNERAERRRTIATYGGGIFGHYNHLTLEAEGGRTWIEAIPSPEIDAMVQQRVDEATLRLGLRLSGKLSLAGTASWEELDLPEIEEEGLRRFLSRHEKAAELGIRHDVTGKTRLTLALQAADAHRDSPECRCDSSRADALVRVEHSGSRLTGSAELGWREISPEDSSARSSFDGLVGRLAAQYLPRGRISLGAWGHRQVTDALSPSFSYLEQDRVGISAEARIGWRTRPRLFVEMGSDDYVPVPGQPARRDSLRAAGARLSFSVGASSETAVELVHASYGGDEERSSTVLSWTFSVGSQPAGSR